MADLALPSLKEIHIWHHSLFLSSDERENLLAFLDADERARAARFRFETDRDAFIASHGWLRMLLGRYLSANPRSITFVRGRYGKPAIYGDPLHFNFSHSGQLAACAITKESEVGIDIEWIRPMPAIEDIARRFLHPGESEKLLALQEDERLAAFFRCWTRKEAYVKALGEGITTSLKSFEVTLTPDEPPALLEIDGKHKPLDWTLIETQADIDYAGAVAIRGTDWAVLSRYG